MRSPALSKPPADGQQTLCIDPLAWLKLQWFCHKADTEIGGFGISAEHNPLYVDDFVTVRQRVSWASVQFDDAAVADFFDDCVDRGLRPARFSRVWVHSHPGASPLPSSVDEETFASKFGDCDWALMFILSRAEKTYARLAFRAGPGGQVLLPVAVHWAEWPKVLAVAGGLAGQVELWQKEYSQNIQPLPSAVSLLSVGEQGPFDPVPWWVSEPWSEELDGVFYEPVGSPGDLHEPNF
jgi:proteasome lid subunit RPN8/RPN11